MLTRTSTLLLEGLKDHANESAWKEFDARYRPLLMAVAHRLGLPAADAEDAVQETVAAFVAGYREEKYRREGGRLRDWLAGIMAHKVRDQQRRNVRQEALLHQHAAEASVPIDEAAVDVVMKEEWANATLRQCLEEIRQDVSPVMYESFELTGLHLWPAQQVAERLGISADAVYQNKRRILQRLREMLPKMEDIW